MRILGVDPSLTGAGCALIDTEDVLVVDTWTVKSRVTDDSITARLRRLDVMADSVLCVDADLIVIEGPAYSSRTGKQHERSGLWWLIVDRSDRRGVLVVEVAPTTLKRYATGKGNAPKDRVLLSVARRYPHVNVTDDNQADAVVLAAMGSRRAGHPVEATLPTVNIAALSAVHWPAQLAGGQS